MNQTNGKRSTNVQTKKFRETALDGELRRRKDGLTYRKHARIPFTGWSELFHSVFEGRGTKLAGLKSRGGYENGLKQGSWESFYRVKNAYGRKRKTNSDHTDTLIFGTRLEVKQDRTTDVDDRAEEVSERFGQIKERLIFDQGEFEGLQQYFHNNGRVRLKATYSRGVLNGLWEEFDKKGRLASRLLYNDGNRVGLSQSFHKNGSVKESLFYVDGELDGLQEYFHKNGQRARCERFRIGNRYGIWEWFDEDGNLVHRGNFRNGKKQGVWKSFYSNGVVMLVEIYRDNELIG